MNGGSYMELLTYKKDIHIGNQMIDVIQTAVTLDICQDEKNDYGEQEYETAC